MLLPYYSIGSDSGTIEKNLSFEFSYAFTPVIIGRPEQDLPVIFSTESGKIEPATWGLRSIRSETKLFPWVRVEGIIKNIYTRALIRNNRCLVLANGFFIKNQTGTYFIYYPGEKVVTFGAVWLMYQSQETDRSSVTFSIISCPAQSRLSHLTGRVPLMVYPSGRRKFLKKDIPLMDITRMLKKENNLDVNGFLINPDLFHKRNISKGDFKVTEDRLYKAKAFPEKAILGDYH